MRVYQVLLTIVVIAGVPVCRGQVAAGTINVSVEDPSGAVVAGASVHVANVNTGLDRAGATNERGEFVAPFLPVGEYTISAEHPGFKKATQSRLQLRVDQTAAVRFTLQPGEVRDTIEVTATTPLLDSESSSLGQVIENKKIVDLPLNGRNPFALGLLSGNTTPMFGMGSNLPFIAGGGRFSANEVTLDGVDNNTISNAGAVGRSGIAFTPSVDAVEEFKVKTNSFSAEFGHAAGAVINATIRSGTNQYHGTLFEFFRNDKLDANNFFTNAAGKLRAAFRQNQFGAAAGGPVLRNRTFFFGDYQGTRQRTSAGTSILDVPTADFRAGDFSKLSTTIYNPTTRRIGPTGTVIADAFAGNRIPISQLNPASAAVLSLIPLPNFGAPGAQSRNYFRQAPQQLDADQGDIRVDHRIGNSNTLFGRFSISDQARPAVGRFDGFIGGGASSIDNARQAVFADTHVFSPTLVNEFRFGYIRHNGSILGDAPQGVDFAKKNGVALFPFPVQGFPTLSFNFSGGISGSQQFTSWGGGDSNLNIENRFQWSDNINIARGSHNFKTGVDIRRERFETLKGTPFHGETIFGSTFSSSSNAPGSGAPFADYLLGFPSFIQGTQMLDWGRQRDAYFGFYFQDDWKATRKLTLNAGLRYELFTQPVDAKDRGGLFDVKTGRFALPGKDGFSRAIVDGDHNNFGPRIGFAYKALPKLVFRGAYGVFYGLRDQNQEVTQFSGNNPNTPTLSVPSISATQTVAPPFTIGTPIIAAPSDTSLASFTPDRPFVRTIRTQGFHDARDPMLHQFNFNIQYEPFASLVLEASYSGAMGRDLASLFINLNQLPFAAAITGNVKQSDRPFPNINGTVIPTFTTATSNYNAVNFKVEKRYSAGLSFLVNYTVQKNIETGGSGPSAYTQNGGTSIALDTYNIARERSVAPIDVPQIFVASYGYELPVGPGKRWLNYRGAVGKIAGGWQINGITTLRGGFPTDIRTNRLPPIFNTFNVADRVAGVPMQVQDHRGVDSFFNPAAFRVPGTVLSNTGSPVQLFGDSARRVARGPGSRNSDLSIFKNTNITERTMLQFRAEFFNLTNTPTFFLPSASSPTLTCIGPSGALCNAGNPDFGKLSSGTATGRQIQFGMKLYF